MLLRLDTDFMAVPLAPGELVLPVLPVRFTPRRLDGLAMVCRRVVWTASACALAWLGPVGVDECKGEG